MNVGSPLKRTNKTSFSDEELLLFDILFDSSDTFESLVKENYASWHNLPYSHHLETGPLKELLDKLTSNGIIKSHLFGPEHKVFYALTETGGPLWEVERAPDWERYCTDRSDPGENGNWTLSVESPSLSTAKAFLECAKDCHLYRFHPDDIRTTSLNEGKLATVEWRAFPTVYSLSVMTYPLPEMNIVDWKEYESKRAWWRDLIELTKFQML